MSAIIPVRNVVVNFHRCLEALVSSLSYWLAIPFFPLLLLALNAPLYLFFGRKKGLSFCFKGHPHELAYYFYTGLSFIARMALRLAKRNRLWTGWSR